MNDGCRIFHANATVESVQTSYANINRIVEFFVFIAES